MPRDGSNIYRIPPGTAAIPDTTVASTPYNSFTADIEQDQNTPRPVVAGGTGAASADAALVNLSAEKAKQVIANFDSAPFVAGSFYSATTATNPPVAGHAFSGICYVTDASNMVVEARDLTDPANLKYVRVMTAGVWSAWAMDGSAITTFVRKAGDTMTGLLQLSADPTAALGAATKQYSDAGDTASRAYADAGDIVLTAAVGNRVRFDAAQALTSAQLVQARQNVYAAPFDAEAYNGMQVNGAMEVTQEKPIGVTTAAGYVNDGWVLNKAGTMVLSASVQNLVTAAGVPYWLMTSVPTAQAVLTAGDLACYTEYLEGTRMSRLMWGTPLAQPLTIAFWSCHHRTGLYTGSVRNYAGSRSYAFSYTQNVADVAEYKTVTIPGDTAGTWLKDSSGSLAISFTIACGATLTAPALNTWYGANYIAGPGQVNGVAATSDIFRITGVLLLPGIEAPPSDRSGFVMRPFGQELLLCQRYWEKSYDYETPLGAISTNGQWNMDVRMSSGTFTIGAGNVSFRVPKRVVPTVITYSPQTGAAGKVRDDSNGVDLTSNNGFYGQNGFSIYGILITPNAVLQIRAHWTADARL